MKVFRFIPLIFLLLDACIDPMQIPLSSKGSLMVVDGMITNEPGPYQVSIFYSSNLENSARLPEPVSGATVSIVNSLGETELLSEISSGVYESSATGMQGVIGVSYYLKIVTKAGEYQSSVQTMEPAGTIDNLYVEFAEQEMVNPDGTDSGGNQIVDAFRLYVDSHGEPADPNLFRWRWTGTYKVRAFPELHTAGDPPSPAPWPCSGYINYWGDLVRIGDCECCICWLTAYSPLAIASETRFSEMLKFQKVDIGSIAVTGRHFYERYHLEVEQLSISEDVHNFWKLVQKQQAAIGSLFQPNAVKIRGNIKSITNPNEQVLGIFSVSAVTKKSIFITPDDLPYPAPAIDTMVYDCRTSYRYSTTEKPAFW